MKKIDYISGNIVDVLNSTIYPGTLEIYEGRIINIKEDRRDHDTFIIPGLIDSHIHIESSMLTPLEFARVASVHGTVATVSDPHEIANVLGVDGIRYMIEDGEKVPMRFYFGAPSCVPASTFETGGASIGVDEIEELLKLKEIKYLAEVMNFPGVINEDPAVISKIRIAKRYSKPIDGHAPGLRGEALKRYIKAGITTDHESLSREEAIEKINSGMKILIREGSAARDFDELVLIIEDYYKDCMFCSDDKHPDDLVKGHINTLVKRAVDYGIDIMKVLRVASVNPVMHYRLDIGLLQKGDYADFLVIDNLRDFNILMTCMAGEVAAEEDRTLIPRTPSRIVNNFKVEKKVIRDFSLPYRKGNINVIEAIDGQLITNKIVAIPKIVDGDVISDVERDILKMAVVNRYKEIEVAVGFVKNFGLKNGAIASSVAHDSHNIIAVGVTDEDICRAVNLVIENRGGVSAVSQDKEQVLPLPVAGIMSNEDCSWVAERYTEIDRMAKSLGSTLNAPFMTLSFMALLVIPKLKLSDRGLFDGERFKFIDLFQ